MRKAAVISAILLVAGVVRADVVNLVQNGGFEDQAVPAVGYHVWSAGETWAGWTAGNGTYETGVSAGSQPHDGAQYGFVNNSRGGNGTFVQYPSVTLQANTRYTLSVDVATGTYSGGFADVFIGLYTTGWQRLARISGSEVSAVQSQLTTNTVSFETDEFGNASILTGGIAPAGTSVIVNFGMLSSSAANTGAVFDNVVFTATVVPEPATLSLLGLGGIAGLVRHRK